MNKPQIYSVMEWRKPEGATQYQVELHFAAGTSSEEAEAAFKEHFGRFDNTVSRADFYITTDELREQYPAAVSCYTTRHENKLCSEDEYRRWKESSTQRNYEDGEVYPAAFRPLGTW